MGICFAFQYSHSDVSSSVLNSSFSQVQFHRFFSFVLVPFLIPVTESLPVKTHEVLCQLWCEGEKMNQKVCLNVLIEKMLIYWHVWVLHWEIFEGVKCAGVVYKALKFGDKLKVEMSQQMEPYRRSYCINTYISTTNCQCIYRLIYNLSPQLWTNKS